MTRIIKPNPSITTDEIVKLENQLQITLPDQYRIFLLEYNGGVTDNQEFKAGKYGGSVLDKLFGLGIGGVNDIHNGLTTFKGRVPEDFLAIGRDQLGNLILLGIKDKYIGKVYFWWHENESEGKKPWLKNIYKIHDSFNGFLDSLKPDSLEEELKGSVLELFDSEDYDEQMKLINSGWDVNSPMEEIGGTAIRRVALKGSLQILKALIDKGAKLDGAFEQTLTYNNIEGARMLLEAGADPNLKTSKEKSNILMDTIMDEKTKIATLLIKYGANVQLGTKYDTPLSLAEWKTANGHPDMQEVVDLIKSKLQA